MANDKNNMNELVTDDDDPTAELKALTSVEALPVEPDDNLSESGADTSDFAEPVSLLSDPSIADMKSALKSRSETIDRLQFDIEQLHARWTGLEVEIQAREELTKRLHQELADTTDKLQRKEKLLRKRDTTIKALKAEIRTRNDEYGILQNTQHEQQQLLEQLRRELSADRSAEVQQSQILLQQQAGRIASYEDEIKELRAQLERTEAYADSLRQKVQERTSISNEAEDTREFLQLSVAKSVEQIEELGRLLDASNAEKMALQEKLDGLHDAHADEIRIIRFELGEAQETVVQHELVTEQLASDLIDTRSFRDELEQMLTKSEENSQSRIEHLEKENLKLKRQADGYEQKLETKSEAINCLLAELSKKSQQIDSIGDIENVIQDIDDRMSERIEERVYKDRDRLSRVLIGKVDGQELRFPLFKDRLTIGRTAQNDIHLNASYVSRRHAVVVTDQDTTRIIDWGSKNGVFVNSNRITEHFLRNGDQVTIGTAEFRYEERPKRET
ncbi:MAG: FHA domain-containing protein [Gammaproteobacteria bacterium]|nr:FHA domain-containing protein [Gammaproteobacteria bacterium]